MNFNRKNTAVLFILILAGWLCSCAAHHVLTIDYKLPDAEQSLAGIRAAVDFEDAREEKGLLGKTAKQELRDFTGKFHFSIARADQNELVGVFDLAPLFTKTVTKRLESMGVVIAETAGSDVPLVRIVLQDFILRFEDRTWKVSIGYEARLLVGDKIRARETVQGSAERVKIIGTSDADKVVGELYSEVMNKLDIEELFKKAGYLSHKE